MWRDLATKPERKVVSSHTTLTVNDIKTKGHFVCDTTSAGITLTLPAPATGLDGWEFYVTADGASNPVTVACSNGFIRDDDSLTVVAKDTTHLICLKDAAGAYRWLIAKPAAASMSFGGEPSAVSSSTSGTAGAAGTASRSDHGHDLSAHAHLASTSGGTITSAAISDFTEAVQDAAGAMWSSNSEVGAAVQYDDAGNVLNVAVAFASSEPPEVVSSTSGTAGVANTAARGDHGHDLGIHDHGGAGAGGTIPHTSINDWDEAVADTAGAMVTGNTETGITVTYQDGDNTIDFAVAYGTEPGAVATSTSGQAGSADSASRSDHNHDLGVHNHADSSVGGTIPSTSISDWGEAVADTVGAMFTSNTETGITISYDDADNTIDAVVAYGTTPADVSSSSSGTAGAANTASRSDHSHNLGSHVHTGATNGGQLSTASLSDWATWTTWVPTLVFSAAGDPTDLTTVARYKLVGKTVWFLLQISGTDGDGKTLVSATPPQTPKDVNCMNPCSVFAQVNGSEVSATCYLNQTNDTAGNRLVTMSTTPTLTNAQSYLVAIRGQYEIA